MTDRPPPRHPRLMRIVSRAGVILSAFLVFLSGYLAMRATDWRMVVVITLLGGVAALVATGLAQRNR